MAAKLRPDMPFIFLSGSIGEELAIERVRRRRDRLRAQGPHGAPAVGGAPGAGRSGGAARASPRRSRRPAAQRRARAARRGTDGRTRRIAAPAAGDSRSQSRRNLAEGHPRPLFAGQPAIRNPCRRARRRGRSHRSRSVRAAARRRLSRQRWARPRRAAPARIRGSVRACRSAAGLSRDEVPAARRGRPAVRHLRDRDRCHRAQEDGRCAADCAPRGGARQSREERLPLEHEPRPEDAAERDSRLRAVARAR